jgi:hypothetical protein
VLVKGSGPSNSRETRESARDLGVIPANVRESF